jgi:type II secretory pathway predicted ATPase ExeA
MYKNFFGLRDNPFNANPDPRYLFLTQATQEALAGLTYGIQSRKGFILLTGEVGTGKTTLLNRLLDWLNEQGVATAVVFDSQLDVSQLFDFMLADFGVTCESRVKSHQLMRLNQWLLERYRSGRTTVLIVDEAQNLSMQVLEEIRLLTNLETAREKLLQIVLSGQPELEVKLQDTQLRQLRQRITIRCKTGPLVAEEMDGYIAERLRIAGANGQPVFTKEAVKAIFKYSGGIPRVTNLLCEHALINSFVDQVKPVPASVVQEVAKEFLLDPPEMAKQHAHAPGKTAPATAPEGTKSQAQIAEAFIKTLNELVEKLNQAQANVPSSAGKGNHE